MLEAGDIVRPLGRAQLLQKVEHIHAGKAGHPVRADLLFIRKHAHRGERRGLCLDLGHQRGVCVDPVVLAVGADQPPVKAHVPGVLGRHGLDLGPLEVPLGDAVFLVQQLHGEQLDPVFKLLFLIGQAAHHNVQFFRLNALGQLAVVLLGAEMRQKVGDAEHRVAGFLAHADLHPRAVLFIGDAVQRQRDGGPLVLAHAAVIMGLQQRQIGALVQGVRLQVQPGRVDVGNVQVRALGQGFCADGRRQHTLFPVDPVYLVARFQRHARHKGPVPGFLQQLRGIGRHLALGLALIQKGLVALAELCSPLSQALPAQRVHLLRQAGRAVRGQFRLIQQFLGQLLALCFFFLHGLSLVFCCLIQRLIFLVVAVDLAHIKPHLLIGEGVQHPAIGRIRLVCQQFIHGAPAAVVGGRGR